MLKFRSNKKELLDGDTIPEKDLFKNLKELDTINTLLGGYNISLSAINHIVKYNQSYRLADIGCGGGDTLKYIHAWAENKNKNISLVGIDIKPVCITYAKTNSAGLPVEYICDDYKHLYKHVEKIDIINACLFCHHLTEQDIVELIQFTLTNKTILIINDLERNVLAYYSIKWLTALFSKSYLVKNDAPLSVARGFKKKEWKHMLQKAGAMHFSLKNKWAFRHQVIVYGNQ